MNGYLIAGVRVNGLRIKELLSHLGVQAPSKRRDHLRITCSGFALPVILDEPGSSGHPSSVRARMMLVIEDSPRPQDQNPSFGWTGTVLKVEVHVVRSDMSGLQEPLRLVDVLRV